ncbi:HAMP domain-containing histidine kinase [Candidatus Nomurabacteria bacterium]|nr:HAMP domain-containing histidine kinase [Candidatus Nomurabacteria bacterium]
MNTILCNFEGPKWLIISNNVPPLVYYSYGIALFSALVFGLLVFFRDRKKLANQTLLFMLLSFSVWIVASTFFWATNRSDVIMFTWSVTLLFEPMVYAGALYLMKVLISKKDPGIGNKLVIFALFLPILILLPTVYGLSSFDLTSCLALEGPIALYYTYAIEIIFTLWIVIYSFSQYTKTKDRRLKNEIIFMLTGILLLLVAFASGNIIGSLTEDWNTAQVGLFGMPIFIGFLSYSIVKFKTFNIKLLATQALVTALIILIGSQFFFVKVFLNQVLTFVAFVAIIVFGNLLIKSVKREVRQREKLEIITKQLEAANEKLKSLDKLKTEFLSLASHQLRSPLTAIKGYASMLSEGDFGALEDKQAEAVKRIYASAQGLVNVVEDLLNVSKIEQGGMKYEFIPTDLNMLVNQLVGEMKIPVENKHLEFNADVPEDDRFMISADPVKLKQVFLNLVDNSIKYTEKGFVHISLSRNNKDDTVVFSVTDSGVGISSETKEKLFQKFSRGEGGKMNTGGSGLGLYLAREIARAHKGDIIIDSEGLGKGSVFKVILPAKGVIKE